MDNKQQPTLLDNWIEWLQARIPALKESHNVFWLKQAMGGYKSDSSKIEPTTEQFCKFHTGYCGEGIDNVNQLVRTSFSGEELVEYLQAFTVFMSKNQSVPTPEAVLFAKHHRERQIEAIINNYEVNTIDEHGQDSCSINEDSIKNAYKEENIR